MRVIEKTWRYHYNSADEGGAIVIQDVKLYIKEAERQLNNTENYRPIPNDPTKINNDTVNKTIKRFRKEHLIKDKVAEGLITQNPATPFLYKAQNLHKRNSWKTSENATKKTIATKVTTTFLALNLTLKNLCSTQKSFYKPKVVQWELSVHHLTQICS